MFGWGKKDKSSETAKQAMADTPDILAHEPVEEIIPETKPPQEDAPGENEPKGWFGRLFDGLKKSSSKLGESVTSIFTKRKLDQETLDELEETLILADLGPPAAARIVKGIAKDRFDKEISEEELKAALASEVSEILEPREANLSLVGAPGNPRVILFVGVNGSGKTTTIGKIAHQLSRAGTRVGVAAGDTFRAAAVAQLKVWADRAGASFYAKDHGADAAALAYEALEAAKADGLETLLIDTAGRLQNRSELMAELAKILRVIRKLDDDAPHDVVLVLDATVGQNALSQVEAFRSTADITGLVMTKLDGTAKGGVLVALAEKHALPIHYVGVGEKAEDLQPFSAKAFSRALVGLED
jgi:fused signal recognition particle receptor